MRPADLDTSAGVVDVRSVVLRYGETLVLSDVSLSVASGSITGLVGRNGAGKSTLINTLAGLLEPERGAVSLFGRKRVPGDPAAMRATGWLLEEPALFQYLKPSETLLFLAQAYGMAADVARARVDDLLRFFDLTAVDNRLADELSTGTAKRLALAAAMIHAPRLLVLDEPFENLDPLMVRRLRRALADYAARGGTILVSSHLIAVIQEICDDIYILEGGRIVFHGPGAQFRTNGGSVPGGSLEQLYAALVEDGGAGVPELRWLSGESACDAEAPAER